MGYDFKMKDWLSIKAEEKEYAWPCNSSPKRTIKIFNDDVLTRSEDGTYMKHTGLGTFGIVIPDEDIIEHKEEVKLRLI